MILMCSGERCANSARVQVRYIVIEEPVKYRYYTRSRGTCQVRPFSRDVIVVTQPWRRHRCDDEKIILF